MTVRTRFAPSPTGLLHIGNARAALFNFLFARHHDGKFLLRIEDTDKARSTQKAVDVILDGLAWMGLDPDEAPIFQSHRQQRHTDVAHDLLARGLAYRCFCTPQELQEMRDHAIANGLPPKYNGMWRDRDPSEAPKGAPFSVRLKAPKEGETEINDLVQGSVRVKNTEMDDLIILRSDGTPTYLHAVVCDDHDMDITHVIRGDDHLTNTFRQAMIYRALEWSLPQFAHLPLIHGPDGAKLSKRHGAQSVVDFRDAGYLPDALCNYLLRLGWGHGDAEILSREAQIELFDLDGVGRAPSRMDYVKLAHLNGVYVREADPTHLTEDVMKRLKDRSGLIVDDVLRQRVLTLMPGLQMRAKLLTDLADSAAFLGMPLPLTYDAKAAKLLDAPTKDRLKRVAAKLALVTPFTAPIIDAALKGFAEEEGVKLGQIAQPLRAAMTGTLVSPGIDLTLEALGRDDVLARIGAAIAHA